MTTTTTFGYNQSIEKATSSTARIPDHKRYMYAEKAIRIKKQQRRTRRAGW